MGFTRYWVRPKELGAEQFALFSAACRTACAEFTEYLTKTEFSNDLVSIEGNPGCEPFVVERLSIGKLRENGVHEYCKTQHLPYDKVVSQCVDLLKEHFPDVEIPKPS